MGLLKLAAADIGPDIGIGKLGRLAVLLVGIQGYRGVIHDSWGCSGRALS
jgi:hypothetical protein